MNVAEVQDLLDKGMGISQIGRIFNVHPETVRRFIIRNELVVYVAFDEIPSELIPFTELERCVFINEEFKVVYDELTLDAISAACGHSKSALKSSLKPYIDHLELDALDKFVNSLDFDEINNANITRHRHVVHYIYKHCGSLEKFREMFGIDLNIVAYSSEKERSYFARAGHRFEYLVGKALKEIYGDDVNDSVHESGCLPDFVIGDRWIDAKLSKSTVISPACETIEKYSKHTDYLVIIYCIDDITDDKLTKYDGVDFVHISELYPYISDELISDISELKEEVKRRKRGLFNV